MGSNFSYFQDEKKDYENLVFSGGGIKGIAYCGAIKVLDKLGILFDGKGNKKIKRYAGASVGSLIASLLALGYSTDELIELMHKLDFDKILGSKFELIYDTYNFFEYFGACKAEFLDEFIGQLIYDKTGNKDYTIEDLFKDKDIFLVIVSTNMNLMKSIYFYPSNPIEEYRKIPIRMAIRMSISIPFLFEPVLYNGDFFVDGGVLDNFPIHVFDGVYPGEINSRLNNCKPNNKTLGINIMTNDDQIDYDISERQELSSLFQYSYSFINMFLIENERRIMTPTFWKRTITLVTPNYPLRTFSLTSEQKNELIRIGEKYTTNFFSN